MNPLRMAFAADDDKTLVDIWDFNSPEVPIGTFKVLGQFDGICGDSIPTVCDYIEVTLNDGTTLPAYRKHAPGANYCICPLAEAPTTLHNPPTTAQNPLPRAR